MSKAAIQARSNVAAGKKCPLRQNFQYFFLNFEEKKKFAHLTMFLIFTKQILPSLVCSLSPPRYESASISHINATIEYPFSLHCFIGFLRILSDPTLRVAYCRDKSLVILSIYRVILPTHSHQDLSATLILLHMVYLNSQVA